LKRKIKKKNMHMSVHDQVLEWLFEPPSIADNNVGNVPLATQEDFEAHVRLVCFERGADWVRLQPLDPIKDAFIICYELVGGTRVRVLGSLTWTRAREWRWLIRKVDLSNDAKSQPKAFVAPLRFGTFERVETHASPFYFPCTGTDNFLDALHFVHFAQRRAPGGALDAAAKRIQWILKGGDGGDPLEFLSPEEDCASFFLMECVGDALEFMHPPSANPYTDDLVHHYRGRRARLQWFTTRMSVEEVLFRNRMSRFRTEQSLVDLFSFNGLGEFLAQHTIVPTVADRQVFLNMWPTADYFPALFLRVPMMDLPANMVRCLPKYERGTVHLPFWYEAVCAWIWFRFRASAQRSHARLRLKQWQAIVGNPLLGLADFVERALEMVGREPDHSDSSSSSSSDSSDDESDASPPTPSTTIDIEECALPPCISQLGHFPKYAERMTIAQIFVEAQLSEGSIHGYFARANEGYPKDPPIPLEQRFDLNSLLQWAFGKPVWCSTLIKNAIRGERDKLMCPLVPPKSEANQETYGICYAACRPKGRFGGKPALRIKAGE